MLCQKVLRSYSSVMSISTKQKHFFEKLLGEKNVIDDDRLINDYSHDETPGLEHLVPDLAVRVNNASQIQKIAAFCHAEAIPLTPRGGGSGHSGGCLAARGGLVMDLMPMQRILEISTDDMIARVEPGVILQDLHHAVEALGLFYPPDPNSLESCSLGGNVAENAGGPRALRYGCTRDYVLGMNLILMDGRSLRLGKRTVKGVSGYDLSSLVVGSEGTLGIISELTLKLIPKPREVATALVSFKSAEQAAQAVSKLMSKGILPRTLEYMDGRSIDAVRPMVNFSFPVDIDAALLVETDGDDADSAFQQLLRAVELLDAQGESSMVAQNPRQQNDLWSARRRLTEATRKIKKHKIAEDIAVPRGRIPETLARIAAIGEAHNILTAAYGHAGDGNLHVQILFDDEVKQGSQVQQVLDQIMGLAIEMGGTLSGEHGIGLAKKRFMHLEHSQDSLNLMREIKAIFDPKNLLNPDKIF